ncbi:MULTISPECIES: hypothetical protein [unclassified Microbacterium]|uniref:hypothetical protein n=1 Tax=unclassified Microbacterium TaxID=2609290 RepID=UPI000D4C7D70|nr:MULTISPECIES: hypothetical protein [unclassified Microbacterium]PQZ60678.1 hypothetical protein CQ032_04020 [Microbacterium sp. MYb43]PQZ82104.1 hypothetical protein CQ031_01420 [Microbacterium sp. MYb40]PRB22966.1 hypothetical protein CQ037_18185 [Microbacterium sp. MYb50]PRB24196.1 hypothetical protein CQ040_02810 [Microbacterium sp. MYb54]PRB69680.1 hypothetical protein CQ021_02815 [Microbacterium sp. MYb24]
MTRPKMIRREKSPLGVTITCTGCPHWKAFALSMGEAHASAGGHEARVHPGDYRARNAAAMFAARHAVRARNV